MSYFLLNFSAGIFQIESWKPHQLNIGEIHYHIGNKTNGGKQIIKQKVFLAKQNKWG